MKTSIPILVLGITAGAFIAGFFYGRFKPTPATPQQITLEQILSIKELHLVKHTYNDLFFLHRKNDKSKAIRAIAQVPVVVTAYLDLKEMKLIKSGDSLKQIILPRAQLNTPHYQVDKMVIRPTRGVQVHVGRDQYATVSRHLQEVIAERSDTLRHLAVTNRILIQTEEEGRAYLIGLLKDLGQPNVVVGFEDEIKSMTIMKVSEPAKPARSPIQASSIEVIPFGFLPMD